MKKYCLIVLNLCLLTTCTPLSPFTSAPGYILMSHDYLTKRDRLKKYAEKGDVYSQYELGMSYCCNLIDQPRHDYAEGMKWLCMAAKNGYSKAQLQLGKIYENQKELEADEQPVPQDFSKAYMWYAVASDIYINYEASRAKKDLANKISNQEIKKAEKDIRHWRSTKCP